MPKIGFHRAAAITLSGLILANVSLADALSAAPGALTLVALGALLLIRRPLTQSA